VTTPAIDLAHGFEAGVPCARRPAGREWVFIDRMMNDGLLMYHYRSGPILAVSSIQTCEMPDGKGLGQQWLVSVSAMGKRPKDHHVRRALRAFGMVGAENDTHHPGNAKHFWLPVDPARRVDCQCKTDEDVIVDGTYAWTNPKDGPCRGCEIAPLMKRPCPIHGVSP
jgi:hypothetical protein